MTYYQRICNLCEQSGTTLEELSEKTGITIHRFKSWNRKHFTPDWELLIKIAEYLNVPLEVLAVENPED